MARYRGPIHQLICTATTGTRRRKTDHPRPETKVASAREACASRIPITRGRKYVSRIIAARVSLCVCPRVDISIGQISPFKRVSPSIECKGRSVSPSLTDKTAVFVPNNGCGPFIDPPIIGAPPNAGTNFSRIRTIPSEISKDT